MARHECGKMTNGKDWMHCCICNGRIHLEGCTSERNKNRDCCPARHKMLYDAGHTRGISDDSFLMWTPYFTEGVHESGR
jgi:hypothetical protein